MTTPTPTPAGAGPFGVGALGQTTDPGIVLHYIAHHAPTAELRALARPCTYCGTIAGLECFTATGRPAPIHASRRTP